MLGGNKREHQREREEDRQTDKNDRQKRDFGVIFNA